MYSSWYCAEVDWDCDHLRGGCVGVVGEPVQGVVELGGGEQGLVCRGVPFREPGYSHVYSSYR